MAEARSLDKRTRAQKPSPALKAEIPRNVSDDFGIRSTIRPETPMGGTAGRAAPRKATRPTAAPTSLRDTRAKNEGFDDIFVLSRSRQKPRKLYDRKALAMAMKASADKAGNAKASNKTKRRVSDKAKLVMAFGLLIALGVGISFALPEVTRVAKVTVHGMSVVSENEIVDALLLSSRINLVNANTPAMEARILLNPKIAKARIRRSFPDRLVVNITERVPVACVLISEEIGTKSIAIDAQGVAFACVDQANSAFKNLPVLSGIRFEHFQPGQRLPSFLVPLLGDIAELSKLSPSPLEAFSEIKIQKITDSEAELLLYPSGRTVPIRMPSRLNQSNLGQALLVLDILSSREGGDKVEEIDFRTGTIVYKTKEAQAG